MKSGMYTYARFSMFVHCDCCSRQQHQVGSTVVVSHRGVWSKLYYVSVAGGNLWDRLRKAAITKHGVLCYGSTNIWHTDDNDLNGLVLWFVLAAPYTLHTHICNIVTKSEGQGRYETAQAWPTPFLLPDFLFV